MQRNRAFVSDPSVTDVPIVMQENDWLFTKGKNGQRLGDKALTDDVKSYLVEATKLYASSLSQNDCVESLTEMLKRIEAWERHTESLRKYVWSTSKVEKAEFSKWKQNIESEDAEVEDIQADIQARILCRPYGELEHKFALARLDRALLGSVLTAKLVRRNLRENAEAADVRNFWFLWAALVFSILGDAGIKLKHPRRKNLSSGPVALLGQLQSKLPEQLQLRKVPAGEKPESIASFRKAAVIAYKIRRKDQTSAIRNILTRWVAGDFRTPVGMHEGIITARLYRLTA